MGLFPKRITIRQRRKLFPGALPSEIAALVRELWAAFSALSLFAEVPTSTAGTDRTSRPFASASVEAYYNPPSTRKLQPKNLLAREVETRAERLLTELAKGLVAEADRVAHRRASGERVLGLEEEGIPLFALFLEKFFSNPGTEGIFKNDLRRTEVANALRELADNPAAAAATLRGPNSHASSAPTKEDQRSWIFASDKTPALALPPSLRADAPLEIPQTKVHPTRTLGAPASPICIFMVDNRPPEELKTVEDIAEGKYIAMTYYVNQLYAEQHGYTLHFVVPNEERHFLGRKVGWAKVKIIERYLRKNPEKCAYGISIDTDAYFRSTEKLEDVIAHYFDNQRCYSERTRAAGDHHQQEDYSYMGGLRTR